MPGISGSTRLAAVIGDPARHSLSPAIHNAAFTETGLDWVYLAFDVSPAGLGTALDAARTLAMGGLSVTMPHKTATGRLVDSRSTPAEALDAVNCVVCRPEGLHGENTDGDGFLAGLRADTGLDPAGLDVLVLGAGGAARAVVEALVRQGAASVAVHNRTVDRARAAAALAGPAGRVSDLDGLDRYHLIVNATPMGMTGGSESALPCPVDGLHTGQCLVDLVYEPAETPWLRAARARGLEAHNGLSMLVHQAALAFELWTDVAAPIEVMAAAARTALGAR